MRRINNIEDIQQIRQLAGGGGGSVAWGGITGTLSNQTDLNNALTGLGNRITSVENKYEIYQVYEVINSGTSGTVTIPTGSTVLLNEFEGGTDAILTTVDSGTPKDEAVYTAAGQIVTTTFDISGNYVFSGIPSGYPVAVIYHLRCQLKDSGNITNIISRFETYEADEVIESASRVFVSPAQRNAIELVSTGCVTLPTFIDNGGGNITVNGLDVVLFSNSTFSGLPIKYTVSSLTTNLTDNAVNYVVADYNAGSPLLKLISDVTLITESEIIPVLTIFRSGSTLHTINWDMLSKGISNKIHQSIVKTQRYRRESGLAMSEAGTRNILLTSGTVWIGANKITLDAIDSSIDNITFYYHSGGVWTSSIVTQYDNTQYDNGTNLVTLTANRYAVNWVFRGVENQKHLYLVLGSGDYTLAQAQSASVPALPAAITSHAVLVGKIIVQNGASTATSIQSAFDIQFSYSAPVNHNDLSNIQGGTAGEYYHLTNAQYTSATRYATNTQDGLLSSADWITFNGKQNALTNPITGTGTQYQVAVFNSATGLVGDAQMTFVDDNLILSDGKGIQLRDVKMFTDVPVYVKTASNTSIARFTPEGRFEVYGIGSPPAFAGMKINTFDTLNGYIQNNIQNLSNGADATCDIVATNNIGTDTSYYVTLGINSSGFNQAGVWDIVGANASYLTAFDGDLSVGTASEDKSIVFHTGGTLLANERMRITDTGIGIGGTPTEQFHVLSETDTRVAFTKYINSTAGATFSGVKARGTFASPTAVLANDFLLNLIGQGHNGTSITASANGAIRLYASENWTATATGTHFAVETTAIGTTTRSEKFRVTGDGCVGIGVISPVEKLEIDGNIKAAQGILPIIKPATDSTTAIQITKADGTTPVLTIDTSTPKISSYAPIESNAISGNYFGMPGMFNSTKLSTDLIFAETYNATFCRCATFIAEGQATTSSNGQIQGLNAFSATAATSTGNYTTAAGGLRNRYACYHRGTGTVSTAFAISGMISAGDATTGNISPITNARFVNAENPVFATASTISNYSGFYVAGGALSNGGIITNRYGLYIEDLVGGTNRYGIWQNGASDINYFAGSIGIGTTSVSGKLHISTELDTDKYIILDEYHGSVSSGEFLLRKARGTKSSPSATQSSDYLGIMGFYGYGTAFGRGAYISAVASQNHSATARGTRLEFAVTTDDSTTNEIAMTITQKGFVKIGNDAPAIRMKKFTGTTPSTEGGVRATAHGITSSKIVFMTAVVYYAANAGVPPAHTISAGYHYIVTMDATNVNLALHATNSENILSKSFTIIIFYEE